MLSKNHKALVNLFTRIKETEPDSALVVFCSPTQIVLTKDYDIHAYVKCQLNLTSEDLAVSLHNFRSVFKIMDTFTISGDSNNVSFISGGEVITVPNLFNKNKTLCRHLMSPKNLKQVGILRKSDIANILKHNRDARIGVEENRLLAEYSTVTKEYLIKGHSIISFVFPQLFTEILVNAPDKDLIIAQDKHQIYAEHTNHDISFLFSHVLPDSTKPRLKQEDFKNITVLKSSEVIEKVGAITSLMRTTKTVRFTIQPPGYCQTRIDGDVMFSTHIHTLEDVYESLDFVTTCENFRKVLKSIDSETLNLCINEQNRVIMFGNTIIPYIIPKSDE